MLAACILLTYISMAFSAEETVNLFGVNIYVVADDSIPTVPEGSAVIVNPCAPYEVNAGKLVLYKNNERLSLGYGKNYSVLDGVYQITIFENDREVVISENNLIGKAEFSSELLGKIIRFVKSPLGVLCLAVVPCLVLIIYDIIRAIALRRPLPEVVPQVKNKSEEPRHSSRTISVSSDGKGTYSRSSGGKSNAQAADEVLFTYTAKQKRVEKKETPIIPLTERAKTEPPVKARNAGALRPDVPTTNKYAKSSAQVVRNSAVSDSNSEQGDAFFSQSAVPQIQRSVYSRTTKNNTSENSGERDDIPRPQKTSAKRSTQIIANKNVDDLMKDDEDIRDKSRYNDTTGFNKRV